MYIMYFVFVNYKCSKLLIIVQFRKQILFAFIIDIKTGKKPHII